MGHDVADDLPHDPNGQPQEETDHGEDAQAIRLADGGGRGGGGDAVDRPRQAEVAPLPELTATGAAAADPIVKTERIIVKRVAGADSAETAIAEVTKGKCGAGNPTMFKLGTVDHGAGATKSSHFIMCNKDGAPVGDRLGALLKARDRIAGSNDVDAEARAKVLGALDEAIAQMKSAR